ncbi:MAG: hypothetical protein FGM52_09625, partial [Mycobacterium sp.]|nr:hypothetical protein [Mycobacterium sp.]
MRPTPELTIRRAGTADIAAMMDLEARYYVGNLKPTQRADGFLSILHNAQWFIDTVRAGGIHVAETDGTVKGFIALSPAPERADPRVGPITRAVLALAEVLEFRGLPIARQRWALRGPVLIDSTLRGRGVYTA